MGEFDRRKTVDMLFLQVAVMNGELTAEEAAELYMQTWFADGVDDA